MSVSAPSQSPNIVVVGAGALGLACALALATRGAAVTVCDPALPLDNASGVAAGMLAPAFEALLDPPSATHFDILRRARDLWPDLAGRLGVALNRDGALWAGGDPEGMFLRLQALGAEARLVTAAAAASGSPGLAPSGVAVFSPEDWRLDAPAALQALRRAAAAAGAVFADQAVSEFSPGRAVLSNGETLAADRLVVAVGASSAALAPELSRLDPVKGQILRLSGGPASGPVVRAEGVYVRPHPGGAWVGATMEAGRADRELDETVLAALRARAEALFPGVAALSYTPAAGVRATTADGLPLVGFSAAPGVLLAAGARRNGWLLAPLVARTIAAQVFDEDPGPEAATLSPARR